MIYLAHVFHWSYWDILEMEDWEREMFAELAEKIITTEREMTESAIANLRTRYGHR